MSTTRDVHAADMPLHTHWNAQELTDAVPLRLWQLLDFDAATLRACDRASANAAALHGVRKGTTYLPASTGSLFRTR